MYFRLTTLKIPPQMSFHQHFFAILFRSAPPMILLTAGTLTDPQLPARASNVCKAGWHRPGGIGRVASTGWHQPGGIGRVASGGWHRPGGIGRVTPPQTKILATPVLSYKLLMKSPYSLHLLFLVFIDPLLYRSPLPSLPSLHLLQLLIYPIHPLLRFPFLLSFSSSYPHPLLFPYSPSRYPCPRCILRPLPLLLLLCNVVMPDYHQSWLT